MLYGSMSVAGTVKKSLTTHQGGPHLVRAPSGSRQDLATKQGDTRQFECSRGLRRQVHKAAPSSRASAAAQKMLMAQSRGLQRAARSYPGLSSSQLGSSEMHMTAGRSTGAAASDKVSARLGAQRCRLLPGREDWRTSKGCSVLSRRCRWHERRKNTALRQGTSSDGDNLRRRMRAGAGSV